MELSNGRKKEGEGRRGKVGERGWECGRRRNKAAKAIIKRGDIWRGSMVVRGAKKGTHLSAWL